MARIPISRRNFLAAAGAAPLAALQVVDRSASAQRTRPPNILLFYPDQMRAQELGFNGGVNVPTPHLDRLAAQGTVFTNSLSTCPLCTPARGMLITGRYPTHTGLVLNWLENNPAETSIAEVFRNSGYRTGFIGKWHLNAGMKKRVGLTTTDAAAAPLMEAFLKEHPESEFVPPGPYRQGFEYWAAYNFHMDFKNAFYYGDTPKRLFMPKYETDSEADLAIDFMRDAQKSDRPFLLVVAPHPPHQPWLPESAPEGYIDRVRRDLVRRPNVPKVDTARAGSPYLFARGDPRYYYAMLANVDDALGRMVQFLDDSGLGGDTIVAVTSDHGEMMGSHNRWEKMAPYEEAVAVPLILRCPGRIPAGRRSDALFTPMDHLPTLAGLAGVSSPSGIDGRDLSPAVLGNRGPDRDAVLMMNYSSHWDYFQTGTDWPEWRAVRTRTHTFVKWVSGKQELYDNVADPYQMHDLVPKAPDVLRTLNARLRDLLTEADDEFLPGTAYANWYDAERNLIPEALARKRSSAR